MLEPYTGNIVLQFRVERQEQSTSKALRGELRMSRVHVPARLVTSGFGTAAIPISPKLHDAILDLHREDPLRRAYVRRRWMHRVGLTMGAQ